MRKKKRKVELDNTQKRNYDLPLMELFSLPPLFLSYFQKKYVWFFVFFVTCTLLTC